MAGLSETNQCFKRMETDYKPAYILYVKGRLL